MIYIWVCAHEEMDLRGIRLCLSHIVALLIRPQIPRLFGFNLIGIWIGGWASREAPLSSKTSPAIRLNDSHILALERELSRGDRLFSYGEPRSQAVDVDYDRVFALASNLSVIEEKTGTK